MKTVAIVGGRLQGMECLYLAEKAGFRRLLIDADPAAPAQKICDGFFCLDVIKYTRQFLEIISEADFVLPALENRVVLAHLTALAKEHGFPLAFDLDAYAVSSSKLESDKRMAAAGIPVPLYYPDAELPLIAKPSGTSGSSGVKKLANKCDLLNILSLIPRQDWVIQEFLAGPSYSIEIIGRPGAYRTYHITELFMDAGYDCKRVLSTPDLPKDLERNFQDIAIKLGNMVQLNGIMDVEVIYDRGVLKVLEIDARMPSQTPTAVYHATGANYVEELYRLFCGGFEDLPQDITPGYVSYEHIKVEKGQVSVLGEHIMTQGTLLRQIPGFLGTVDAITDWQPGKEEWVATLIYRADSAAALAEQRRQMFASLAKVQGRPVTVRDEGPKDSL